MSVPIDYSKFPKPDINKGIIVKGYKKLEYTDYFYEWSIANSSYFPSMNNLAHVWGLKLDTVKRKMAEKNIVLTFADSEPYKNFDWCYEQFITQHKTVREVAKETGYKWRVLQKWAQEKFKLNMQEEHKNIQPTPKQLSLIYGGILGDGCISTEGQYYIGHCEKQKEYLEWQREELDSLCTGIYHVGFRIKAGHRQIFGKKINTQNFYQFSTRKLNSLKEIRLSGRQIDIAIDNLDHLGLSIYFLDDGSCSKTQGSWNLCCGILNRDQCEALNRKIEKLITAVGQLRWIKNKNSTLGGMYELRFKKKDSELISKMILNNIPNDLDIVKSKLAYYNENNRG